MLNVSDVDFGRHRSYCTGPRSLISWLPWLKPHASIRLISLASNATSTSHLVDIDDPMLTVLTVAVSVAPTSRTRMAPNDSRMAAASALMAAAK
jgi:hypothetical protein